MYGCAIREELLANALEVEDVVVGVREVATP
jgi:hypothetical protein